jgi:AcrR family transcriptional regulator
MQRATWHRASTVGWPGDVARTGERAMATTPRLVSKKRFRATSVGAIEEDAGLASRSAALYQYLEGEDAVLRAVIERELAAISGQ